MKISALILLMSFQHFISSFGQELKKSIYMILEYEVVQRGQLHESKYYFISDLNGDEVHPIYFDGISVQNRSTCCNGDSSYLFTMTSSSNYGLDSSDENQIEQIKKSMDKGWFNVQRIKKKSFITGETQRVKIRGSLIEGLFCRCILPDSERKKINDRRFAYIPLSDFRSIPISEKKHYMKYLKRDYYKIPIANTPYGD